MVGSAVATMVWSSAAKNIASIRLTRMERTSSFVSGAGGAIGGASGMAITRPGSSGKSASIASAKLWDSAGRRPCRSNLFMRKLFSVAPPRQRRFAMTTAIYAANAPGGRHLRAWVHPAAQPSRNRDRPGYYGLLRLRPLFHPSPLGQHRRPADDVVLKVGIGDIVFAPLHPAAHGNARFMHGVWIA